MDPPLTTQENHDMDGPLTDEETRAFERLMDEFWLDQGSQTGKENVDAPLTGEETHAFEKLMDEFWPDQGSQIGQQDIEACPMASQADQRQVVEAAHPGLESEDGHISFNEVIPPAESQPPAPKTPTNPPVSSRHHYLHNTIAQTLLNYNSAPHISPTELRLHLRLRLFIFHNSKLLLFSSTSTPEHLTTPSRFFSFDTDIPLQDDQLAWQAMQILEPLIRLEKLVGLQFVDFAFQAPIVEANVDGVTLDVAVVLLARGCALEDESIESSMRPLIAHTFVDPKALATKYLRTDVSPGLLRAVTNRCASFTGENIAKLGPQALKSLCLNTLDTAFFLRFWTTGERYPWAAIGQVEKYPFEGLFILPLLKKQYQDAAEAGFTHWRFSNWEYAICGSANMYHLARGQREESATAQTWLLDRGHLAQIFDEKGLLRVAFMKTPKKLRFEKKDDGRPLDRDDLGQIWSSAGSSSSVAGR